MDISLEDIVILWPDPGTTGPSAGSAAVADDACNARRCAHIVIWASGRRRVACRRVSSCSSMYWPARTS
jgi:hypothetical protein